VGELRACLLPVRALRALLGAGPANRAHVRELAAHALTPARRPEPLGPIFTRVPGAPLVRDDEPTPGDLDRLLGGDVVPPDRTRATWRLVEAVASGMAASTTRTMTGRPVGLAPLGLALPQPDDLVVGSWTLTQAAALPSLSSWLDDAVAQVPAGSDAPQVIVFWEAGSAG
jgi:hypothetical protein